MKRITTADQPFELQDGILAFCLYLAGVPFLTTRNLYTAETLKKLGYSGEVDMGDAALECVKKNVKGKVDYLFKRVKAISRLVKLFREQEAAISAPDVEVEARDVAHSIMT